MSQWVCTFIYSDDESHSLLRMQTLGLGTLWIVTGFVSVCVHKDASVFMAVVVWVT